ncbi:MAG: ribosomal protein S18-alanine N-acetyltransferase [Eubacterium sp.]|nr:ribosomal protein S18-alanine N-acetyltransferase [Eubacterium sp.]
MPEAEIIIRKMCAADLDAVARIETENFSTPWKRADFEHYLDDPQVLFLVAVLTRAGATECDPGNGLQQSAPSDAQQKAGRAVQPKSGGAEQKTIAGYIGCLYAADEGDITNVSVDAACRRRGIGRELVRTLLTESARRGCERIFLEVRQSNEAAVRLYEMHGFQEISIRKNYYQKPAEDALLMRYENKG